MKLIIRGLDELKRAVDPKAFRKAVPLALNRAASSGKTAASSAIRDVYNIKKRELDSYMTFTTKALVARPYVVFRIRSRPLGLIHFGAEISEGEFKTRRGKTIKRQLVSGQILTKKGKRPYPEMFAGRARISRSWQIFKRVGVRRLPIFKPAVISPTSMFNKYGREAMEKKFDEVFFKRFEHEYNRARRL